MKWRTFSMVTAALLILPLGTYAAQLHQQVDNPQECTTNMTKLAQFQVKHGRKQGRGERMKQLLEQLDLTPEQSQEIEAIKENSRTENEALRQQMQTKHEEMGSEAMPRGLSLLASESTPEQLRQQHQQLQDLHQQSANTRFETMLEVREVLTAEQRTQLAELIAQHRDRKGR